jgi:hypothetical protein
MQLLMQEQQVTTHCECCGLENVLVEGVCHAGENYLACAGCAQFNTEQFDNVRTNRLILGEAWEEVLDPTVDALA